MSPMLGFIRPILGLVLDLFRSRAMLQAEVLALRRQIIVLRRRRAGRPPFSAADRWVLGWICQLFPRARDALAIVRPEMVLRRHRAGFRSYWRLARATDGSSTRMDAARPEAPDQGSAWPLEDDDFPGCIAS